MIVSGGKEQHQPPGKVEAEFGGSNPPRAARSTVQGKPPDCSRGLLFRSPADSSSSPAGSRTVAGNRSGASSLRRRRPAAAMMPSCEPVAGRLKPHVLVEIDTQVMRLGFLIDDCQIDVHTSLLTRQIRTSTANTNSIKLEMTYDKNQHQHPR